MSARYTLEAVDVLCQVASAHLLVLCQVLDLHAIEIEGRVAAAIRGSTSRSGRDVYTASGLIPFPPLRKRILSL